MAFAEKFSSAVICVTKRGYVGLLPRKARPGDHRDIFHGGAVPFLLRKSDQNGGYFRLLGECYLHGIMHGEALWFQDLQEEDISLH